MFIRNPLKKSEIFVNLWIYILCISHIFYLHPIQVSSSFFSLFYLLVYWLHTSQHVEDECCDLQRETLWSPFLFLISRRPSRIQSPVGRSETRPTCPRAVVPLFDRGLRGYVPQQERIKTSLRLEWEGFLVAFQEKRFYFLIINNYLLWNVRLVPLILVIGLQTRRQTELFWPSLVSHPYTDIRGACSQ